ncbi:hypothetical protein AGMMS50239_09720 [Bacteroidia bacterium]|nr:hypothetical protein AGMMS50239_09720 [Bacteroidia bacterium]
MNYKIKNNKWDAPQAGDLLLARECAAPSKGLFIHKLIINMKKNLFVLFFYLVGLSQAFSQSIQENNQFIPPSPTVSELGKYGMIPVSHYTGVPDISIPIYTIQCGSLTLPITLRYHAGGIRVEQIASWVGLGWSLNAGGIISTSIMGTSDFNSPHARDIKNWDDINHGRFPTQNDLAYSLTDPYTKDLQPDIYSYNFNGHSGQFVLDNNFQAHEIRNNKQIKIRTNKTNKTFSIVDDRGIIYDFTAQELTTTNFYQCSWYYATNTTANFDWQHRKEYCNTGWFLTRVSSLDNADVLTFTYANENQEYKTKVEGTIHNAIQYNSGAGWLPNEVLNYQQILNQTKRLTKITGSNGLEINFTADTLREDLTGSKKLDKITISYNNALLKQWKFDYNYFTASPTITSVTEDMHQNKRLRLASVTENQTKTWTFSYFGDASGENKMPFRTAYYGSDYWGYCNGPVTNATIARNPQKLFPNVEKDITYYRYPAGVVTDHFSYTWGASKVPVSAYAKTYTLKKITYPTGGYSEFIYELHDYYGVVSDITCGGLRIKEIKDYLSGGGLATKKNYQYKSPSNDNSSGSIINGIFGIKTTKELWLHEYDQNTRALYSGEYFDGIGANDKKVIELNSSSYTSQYSYGGDYIGYSYVTETDENGSTRYNFFSIDDYPNQYESIYMLCGPIYAGGSFGFDRHEIHEPIYPFLFGYWGKAYGRGLLKNKQVYNSNNQKVYAEENTYTTQDVAQVYGWEVQEMLSYSMSSGPNGNYAVPGSRYEKFYANCYFHQTGQALLTQTTTTQYDMNGANPVTTVHSYQYNDKNQISQDVVTVSDNTTYKKEFKYPNDFKTIAPYSTMVSKNILSPVVEQSEYKGTQLISRIKVDYMDLKEKEETFVPQYIKKQTSNQTALETRTTFQYFGYDRNPVYISKDDAEKVVYLWGYKCQYPIAKIENATFDQVKNILGETLINRVRDAYTPSAADLTAINNLRTHANLSGAQVTTYTYKPLVGILSTTDPRGFTAYYEYDAFGRLQYIKDHTGNTIEKYDYHYKNP